jgi:hypothetical protein
VLPSSRHRAAVFLAFAALAGCLCNGIGVHDELFACKKDSECAAPNVCVGGVCGTAKADAGPPDAGPPDSGPDDAGTDDAGMPDAGEDDAGFDAGLPDGGPDPCGTDVYDGGGDDGGVLGVYCAVHRQIVIDGDLSDWAGVPFRPLNVRNAASVKGTGHWTGDAGADDADSSGLIALQWDLQYLYVAAAVTDDVRALHPGTADYFQDDAFQVYLDGNHDRAVTYGADDLDLLMRADNAGEQYDIATDMDIPGLPMGALSATQDAGVNASWNIELAIPWSRLGPLTPTAGRVIGIDLIIDDDDKDDDSGVPDRKHYLILFQNSTDTACQEPWCSTAAFGDALLTGQP